MSIPRDWRNRRARAWYKYKIPQTGWQIFMRLVLIPSEWFLRRMGA